MDRNIELLKQLESEIGPRTKETKITSANRGKVKKWLRNLGIASARTEKMKLATLQKCYQSASYLAAVLTSHNLPPYGGGVTETFSDVFHSEEFENAFDTEVTVEALPDPEPIPTQEAKPVAKNKMELLAALLESDKPEVDMDEVRRVAGEEARKVAVSTEVVVTMPTGEVNRVEGAHHYLLPEIIQLAGLGKNVFLSGPAGSGKTTTCRKVSDALGRDFYFTGAVPSEHKLIGWIGGNDKVIRTPFRDAFEHGGVFLFDEIDSSNPAALLALNAALDNRICAFPDKIIEAHPDFVAVGSANTWGHGANAEYCGRNRLDGASLQRFIRMEFGYDEKLERAIASNGDWVDIVQAFRKAKDKLGVKVIVSPRESINGSDLLAAGFKLNRVKELLLAPELDHPTRLKVLTEMENILNDSQRNAA